MSFDIFLGFFRNCSVDSMRKSFRKLNSNVFLEYLLGISLEIAQIHLDLLLSDPPKIFMNILIKFLHLCFKIPYANSFRKLSSDYLKNAFSDSFRESKVQNCPRNFSTDLSRKSSTDSFRNSSKAFFRYSSKDSVKN